MACDPSVYVPHLITVVASMIYRFAGFKVGHPWTLVTYRPHCCHCVVRWCMHHDKNNRDERSDKRHRISASINRLEPLLEMSTISGAQVGSSDPRAVCPNRDPIVPCMYISCEFNLARLGELPRSQGEGQGTLTSCIIIRAYAKLKYMQPLT